MNRIFVACLISLALGSPAFPQGENADTASVTFQSGEIQFDGSQFKGSVATIPENFRFEVQYQFTLSKAADKVKVENHPSGFEAGPSCRTEIRFNGTRFIRFIGIESGRVIFLRKSPTNVSAVFASPTDFGVVCKRHEFPTIQQVATLGSTNFSSSSEGFHNFETKDGKWMRITQDEPRFLLNIDQRSHGAVVSSDGDYTLESLELAADSMKSGELHWYDPVRNIFEIRDPHSVPFLLVP